MLRAADASQQQGCQHRAGGGRSDRPLRSTVLAERHGANRKGSTALAIYFPNSTLYSSPVAGPQSYTGIARRFAGESLWDDFMAFHYLDRGFQPTASEPYAPTGSYITRAPGAGQITLSDIRLSSSEAAPEQPVDLSVNVSGSNIGYIKLFVGYFDAASNSLNITDSDYLESQDVRQVGGVFYPAWPDGSFDMTYQWDVTVFGISDGTRQFAGALQPAPTAVGGTPDMPDSPLPLKQMPLWEEMQAEEDRDPLLPEAIDLARRQGRASISMLQRRLRIGYTRAARLIETMESKGIIGPPEPGTGTRQILDYGEMGEPEEE